MDVSNRRIAFIFRSRSVMQPVVSSRLLELSRCPPALGGGFASVSTICELVFGEVDILSAGADQVSFNDLFPESPGGVERL